MEPDKTALRLPLMRSFKEAAALSTKNNDPFYLDAFAFQCWLGDLLSTTIAEYAEKKNPRNRLLQSGQAWQGFQKLFAKAGDEDFPTILSHLLRFAKHDDPQAANLRQALIPLSLEHECTGEYFGAKSARPTPALLSASIGIIRRSLVRWCDWLDASVHFDTHAFWRLAPAAFDPDPDKRELAALGIQQCYLAHCDDSAKARWLSSFSEAAERFKDSTKWPTLGRAMSAQTVLPWPYARVDAAVIRLWPLVKKYNWTYRDLLNVLRPALKRPTAYPCNTEQEFSPYCANVLGLRKPGRGRSARNGKPEGYEIARKLLEQDDKARNE